MNENMLTVKAMIATFFTALGAFLGWKGVMLLAWVGVMALDYLSGTVAAIADAVMVIIVEHVPIGIQWPGLILPMVLAWYIITELGSILENAILLGAPVPSWLVSMLKASANIVEAAGDLTANNNGAAEPEEVKE